MPIERPVDREDDGLAGQVAALLPAPPPLHDAFGYLAWEELVLTAAGRLRARVESGLLDAGPAEGTGHAGDAARRDTGRLTGVHLLELARGLDDAWCSDLLAALSEQWRTTAVGSGAR